MLRFTWLGHSTFLLGLPTGKRVARRSLARNPNCPPEFSKPDSLKPIDMISCRTVTAIILSDARPSRARTHAPDRVHLRVGILPARKRAC
jgi:hypothetical protein